MKNRAKCKLCNSIIETNEEIDFIYCKCTEIFVSGVNELRCGANDWNNFLRVDDNGNEIIVKVKDDSGEELISKEKDKDEIIDVLKKMIDDVEKLPMYAMSTPITHYDYHALLVILLGIFKKLS